MKRWREERKRRGGRVCIGAGLLRTSGTSNQLTTRKRGKQVHVSMGFKKDGQTGPAIRTRPVHDHFRQILIGMTLD